MARCDLRLKGFGKPVGYKCCVAECTGESICWLVPYIGGCCLNDSGLYKPIMVYRMCQTVLEAVGLKLRSQREGMLNLLG